MLQWHVRRCIRSYLFSPFLVQEYCHTVFVFEFSSTHINVSLTRPPHLSFVWSPRHGKQESVPSAVLNLTNQFFDVVVTSCSSVSLASISTFASFLVLSLLPLFTFSGSSIITSLLRMHSGTSPSMYLSPCVPPPFPLVCFSCWSSRI